VPVLVIKDANYPWLLRCRGGKMPWRSSISPRSSKRIDDGKSPGSPRAERHHQIRQAQYRGTRQCGAELHVHVIARRKNDAAWPRPSGRVPPLSHDAEEVQNFISALRRKIWLG